MSHSHKDHPIAGFVFLLVMALALGFGAKAGIEAGQRAAVEKEKQRALAEEEGVKSIAREAVEAGRAGHYDQAETLLRKAAAQRPHDPNVLFNLGIALLAQEKDAEADAVFQQVLAVAPKDYDAIAERAGIKKRGGNIDEAIVMLNTIPPGEGHMAVRLSQDPLWADLSADGRIQELRKRHGITGEQQETTIRNNLPKPE